MTAEELRVVLEDHAKYLGDSESGKRADLQGANLQGANLRRANLRDADLQGANLVGADMWHADLRHANLLGANLRRADLQGADLLGANLLGANLRFFQNARWLAVEAQPGIIQIGCETRTKKDWLENADAHQDTHRITSEDRVLLEAFVSTCQEAPTNEEQPEGRADD